MPPADADTPGRRASARRGAGLRPYAIVLSAALLAAFLLRASVLHAYRIPSSSMEDTLLAGDFLLAERVSFGSTVELPWTGRELMRLPAVAAPHRGDVVIFRGRRGSEIIKRCVAHAGDTVEVRRSVLLVNGQPLDSVLMSRAGVRGIKNTPPNDVPYDIVSPLLSPQRNFGPHVVPPGHIFVMGDNRANSEDSRAHGDVPLDALRARPLVIYWSGEPDTPWWRRPAGIRWGRVGQIVR